MNRKTLLRVSGASIAATAVAPLAVFDPREARAQGAPYTVLSADEAATLETLADAIVPGAKVAGVAHYVDHELASASPRLLLRFSQLPGPMAPYYHGALSAFGSALAAQNAGAFGALTPDAQTTIIESLRTGALGSWPANAPVAAALFYSMMRNDGVDVVYGSVDGFKNLDMPYMPHILPKTTW